MTGASDRHHMVAQVSWCCFPSDNSIFVYPTFAAQPAHLQPSCYRNTFSQLLFTFWHWYFGICNLHIHRSELHHSCATYLLPVFTILERNGAKEICMRGPILGGAGPDTGCKAVEYRHSVLYIPHIAISKWKVWTRMGLEECAILVGAGHWLQGCLVHMEWSHLHGKVLPKALNYKAHIALSKLWTRWD